MGTNKYTRFRFHCFIIQCVVFIITIKLSQCQKYKLCVVDGKGAFVKSQKYCPMLDMSMDSKVECVVAPDRTACLRKMLKGDADFSVFYPEDLVAAQIQQIEVLVTNEIRYTEDPFEYEVVAVIDNKSGISSKHDLRGKKYCHPGYGYETDWTRILSNYFEASIVTPSCDTKITLIENRIKASNEYFGAACKAGPWVNDIDLDSKLKTKYSKLCQLCGNPVECSKNDEYWGRRGSLLCLTDGAGDVSWARLDDVQSHFGLSRGDSRASPDGYSFLCPDDTIIPLNSSKPCVWVVKPWPVVAARRTVADDIREIVSTLTHNEQQSWRFSLLKLIETSYSTLFKLDTLEPIETYLSKAKGFLNANSFSGCHPPRTIRICTTSVLESNKCSWMRDSAAVFGIEPDLDCLKADNVTHCMVALNSNAADVVIVPSDSVHMAKKIYNLRTFFYETVSETDKYLTIAVTRSGSDIKTMDDLKGRKSCFPIYDGVAWNTIKQVLHDKGAIGNGRSDVEMFKYFGDSCVPQSPDEYSQVCKQNDYVGDDGALRCLNSELGDVAFVSQNSFRKFLTDNPRLSMENFNIICQNKSVPCFLSWAPVGQAMIRQNTTDLWIKDSLDVFLQLDELFGKNHKMLTSSFTLFGRYEGVPNVLFHDATVKLRTVPNAKDTEWMTKFYNDSMDFDDNYVNNHSTKLTHTLVHFISVSFILISRFLNF